MKDNSAAAATAAIRILNDLDCRLIAIFESCIGYEPNAYELETIKKEITEDDRLTFLRN